MSKNNNELIADLFTDEYGSLHWGNGDDIVYPFYFHINEDGTVGIVYDGEFGNPDEDYTIPNKVNDNGTIRDVTVYEQDCPRRLVIPDSILEIDPGAFENCRLEEIELPNSITKIDWNVFMNCEELVTVNIPESVTEIGDDAFNGCKLLPEIIIPNGVIKIGEHAFAGCAELSELTIPASVEELGEGVFEGCDSLQDIWIENAELDYSRAGIPETATIHVVAKGGEKPQVKASTAQEAHTREEWIEKSSPVHLEVVDAVVKSINKWTEGGEYTLTYKKEFVGMNRDGMASNWVYFKPRRKKLMMFVKVGVKKQLYTILNGCLKDQFSVMNENDGYELEIPIEDGKKPAMDWLEAIEPVLRQAEKERMKK